MKTLYRRTMYKRTMASLLAAVMVCTGGGASIPAYGAAAEVDVDETMYVNLDYYGNTSKVNVVKTLSMNGNRTYTDYGDYQQVVNMTGDEEPVLGDGTVQWTFPDGGSGRFYYKATLDNEQVVLPWTFDVSYKLNGVPTDADKLAGASGLVEIHITAEPNEQAKLYYRNNMMLVVAVPVDMSECYSVEAEGAQTQTMGETTAVVFTALPGEEGDYTVRIGTDSFETIGVIMAMAPGTLEDLEHIKDLKEDKDTWRAAGNELYDSMEQMAKSVEGMREGVNQVQSGMGSAESAREKWSGSKDSILAGNDQVLASLTALSQQLGTMVPHLQTAKEEAEVVHNSMNDIMNTLGEMQDPLRRLETRLENMESSAESIGEQLPDIQSDISIIVASDAVFQEQVKALIPVLGELSGALDAAEAGYYLDGVDVYDAEAAREIEEGGSSGSVGSGPAMETGDSAVEGGPAVETGGSAEKGEPAKNSGAAAGSSGNTVKSGSDPEIEMTGTAAAGTGNSPEPENEAAKAAGTSGESSSEARLDDVSGVAGNNTGSTLDDTKSTWSGPADGLKDTGSGPSDSVVEIEDSSEDTPAEAGSDVDTSSEPDTSANASDSDAAPGSSDSASAASVSGISGTARAIGKTRKAAPLVAASQSISFDGLSLIDYLGKIAQDSDQLTGSMSNLMDNLSDSAGFSAEIVDYTDYVIEDLKALNDTLDTYYPDLQQALDDSKELVDRTTEALNNGIGTMTIVQNTLKDTSNDFDAAARDSLRGSMELLDKSLSILDSTTAMRQAGRTMKDVLDRELDKFEDENRFLYIDPSAEKESFTSDKNKPPKTLQVVLRTDEISLEDEGKTLDAEQEEEQVSPLRRMWNVLVKLWQAIVSIFKNR